MVLRIVNLTGLNHIYVIYAIGLKLFMLILSYQILKPIISEYLKAQFWVLCYSLFSVIVCLML